jgi:hypothetical protein
MPDFLQSLADNLKLQILAIAPDSARASLEGLPGVAFLGGAGLIGLILVWILFSLLGALFGGGKKRDEEEALAPRRAPESRREEPRRQTPPQQRPPQPAPAPAAPQPAPAQPGPDSRAAYQEAMQCGNAALQSGDPGGALNNYKHALDIARQQSATRPDDVDAQRATAQAMHRVGDTYALRKEFNLARQHHEQALVILRRLANARPNDLTIAREVAVTLERVGAACAATGDRAGARKAWEEELAIAVKIAAADPKNLAWVRFQAVIYVMIGNLNESDSRARYEQARQMFEVLERAGQLQGSDQQTLNQLRQVLGAA